MLHNKCKERGVVEESLISPETSFVMPLHLLRKPENGNLEEALREHEVSRIASESSDRSSETGWVGSPQYQDLTTAFLYNE
jgi:hypothetical protein